MSNVYLLKHSTLERVKIGKADDVGRRIEAIGREKIDESQSWVLGTPCSRSAYMIETILHNALSEKRMPTSAVEDGGTEWFDASAIEGALNLMPGFARMKPKDRLRKKTAGMVEVEAARSAEMVEEIRRELASRKGEVMADIWSIGVETGLKIGELMALRMSDFKSGEVSIRSSSSRNAKTFYVSETVREIADRRKRNNPDHIYLFQSTSNRAKGLSEPKPMNRSGVSRALREIGSLPSISVRLGTESMRKTHAAMTK